MTVFRVPAKTTQPKHWLVAGDTGQPSVIACGAPTVGARYTYTNSTDITCPACCDVILRRKCYAPKPGDLLGLCCMRDLVNGAEHEGRHDWEVDEVPEVDPRRTQVQELAAVSYAASAERDLLARRAAEESRHPELDSPSGLLPVRVPGAALRDAEAENGATDAEDSARPAESILGHPIIERWPA